MKRRKIKFESSGVPNDRKTICSGLKSTANNLNTIKKQTLLSVANQLDNAITLKDQNDINLIIENQIAAFIAAGTTIDSNIAEINTSIRTFDGKKNKVQLNNLLDQKKELNNIVEIISYINEEPNEQYKIIKELQKAKNQTSLKNKKETLTTLSNYIKKDFKDKIGNIIDGINEVKKALSCNTN